MAPESAIPRFRRSLVAFAGVALVASVLTPIGPAHAVNGMIEGTVTSVSVGPLENVLVRLLQGPVQVAAESTDSLGEYSFGSLAYGDYSLQFEGGNATPPHAAVFWDGSFAFQNLTTFAVSNSTPIVRDIFVFPGSTINGTVTGESGFPANGLVVLRHFVDDVSTFLVKVEPVAPNGTWETTNLPAGEWSVTYSDLVPSSTNYRTQYHDQKLAQADQQRVPLTFEETVSIEARMTEAGPIPTARLAGSDRYATSNRIAQEFESFNGAIGSYVYVASGANYPDALSAAPAAAKRGAPLLLTPPSSLPASVAAEITRLDPENIVVAGGVGAVSNAVFASLQALIDDPEKVVRIGGASRYETSRLLVGDAFNSAPAAFVATGRNFPDALAAAAAAGYVQGPVVLVDGNTSAAGAATKSLLNGLGVETVYVAGGNSVVSPGIKSDLETIPGVNDVTRLAGSDRYATSVAINEEIFPTAFEAYIAAGAGFADALAGAALAGSSSAPLYTVPGTCIPDDVLTHFRTIEVDELYLFGGIGVLTAGVANLVRC